MRQKFESAGRAAWLAGMLWAVGCAGDASTAETAGRGSVAMTPPVLLPGDAADDVQPGLGRGALASALGGSFDAGASSGGAPEPAADVAGIGGLTAPAPPVCAVLPAAGNGVAGTPPLTDDIVPSTPPLPGSVARAPAVTLPGDIATDPVPAVSAAEA